MVPGERYQAAVSVGTNPTFSGRTRTVEAFVLDAGGRPVRAARRGGLRGPAARPEKFSSVEDLVAAMGRDTDNARMLLAAGD